MRYDCLSVLVASCTKDNNSRASPKTGYRLSSLTLLNLLLLRAFTCAVLFTVVVSASAQSGAVSSALIGDYGNDGIPERNVAHLVRSWNPDFVITVEDNNYENGSASTTEANTGKQYHSFIFPYTGTSGDGAAANLFPRLSNQNWKAAVAKPYLNYFVLPNNERYFDFIRAIAVPLVSGL